MQIKCPACGAVASLDLLLAAEDGASEVIKIAAEMQPELWRLMVQYLALFRPQKTKLSFSRMASLLGELHPMIKNAVFERSGKQFHAPLNYWLAAIEQMLAQRDRLTLPLKSHGYLFEIMMSIDAKSIKDIEKTVTERSRSTPPEQTPQPEATKRNDPPSRYIEPPKDVMSKDEGLKALQDIRKTLGVKLPPRMTQTEDTDQQTQQAKAEMQRLLEQEQAQRHQRLNHES